MHPGHPGWRKEVGGGGKKGICLRGFVSGGLRKGSKNPLSSRSGRRGAGVSVKRLVAIRKGVGCMLQRIDESSCRKAQKGSLDNLWGSEGGNPINLE